jgi:hypothetical protein
VVVVRLVVVERSSRLNQQESASACLGRAPIVRPPHLAGSGGKIGRVSRPPHSALRCSHWSTREVRGGVLMGHHHQIVSNPRTRECGEHASEPSWCGGEERKDGEESKKADN